MQGLAARMGPLAAELKHFLSDGVLSEEFVLHNVDTLLAALRNANVAVRQGPRPSHSSTPRSIPRRYWSLRY